MLYKDDLISFIHKLQARDEKAAAWTDLMVDECMKAQNTVKSRILFVEEIW